MNSNALLPALVLASSLLPGLIIFALPEKSVRARTILNLFGASAKIALVGVMIWGVYVGQEFETRIALLPNLDLALRVGSLSLFFLTLSAVLWFVTTIYAIGYLEEWPHRSRFFGFFSLCVTTTVGVAMADNLLTFLVFYELLTLVTYPLVVHSGSTAARKAGQTYLRYTIFGGALLFVGMVWLYTLTGTLEFTPGGFVSGLDESLHSSLIGIFVLLIAGLGVKAALVPLHGWLPQAMVAPAPVSALLHAVAVVKVGAFGIVRVMYDVFGLKFAATLGVAGPLAVLAAFTIIYGSLRALFQDDLKRLLAFSTVSQISYITLGAALIGPVAAIGGLVHLVHQGMMKITLFFCAGNLAETLGVHKVSEMNGVGRRMPWTMASFTIGAFGMIGVPPIAGFVSKWYLGIGALEAGQKWVIPVLVGSTILNAGYFLPILHAVWFREPVGNWPKERDFGARETALALLIPTILTATMSLGMGILASMPLSPLVWARYISDREFFQP